jgi:hypothetical protein
MSAPQKRSHPSDADLEAIREIRKKYAPQFLELTQTINTAAQKLMDINENMCDDAMENGGFEKEHVTFDVYVDSTTVNQSRTTSHVTFDVYVDSNGRGTSLEEVLCMAENMTNRVTGATGVTHGATAGVITEKPTEATADAPTKTPAEATANFPTEKDTEDTTDAPIKKAAEATTDAPIEKTT